ncbi:anti-sigma factor antagonist [Streptomyces sp. NPDC007856]|uniref:anti-sigma factor antagonist n=1 Tax=Streptomyces sp. NPDC007856 TaxID=3364781 RepID=UPI0036C34F30
MTIEGRCTIEQDLGILSVAGHLGREAVRRFGGAVGWVVARGTGPVILDLTALLSRSAEGRLAITEAARRLAGAGRGLEPAAIPVGGSLVPTGDCPDPRPLRPGRRPRRRCPAPIGPRGGAAGMAHRRPARLTPARPAHPLTRSLTERPLCHE